ncbi:GEVED domain-containing protein, partial [Flavobacterium sp. U410]
MKKITLMLTLVFSVFINAQTFNGTGGAIPDNSCGTAHEFPVTVSGVGVLGAANVLDNIALDITHTWDADLDIYIIAPDGTSVELSTDNGGSGDNYTGTIFSASAATLITSGTAPFTGVYKPEGDLSTLMGIDADGIWILRVCDDGVGDTGTLNSWSISFTVAPTCVEPNLLAASNITPYSVQLDWNDPSGSQFDFEYLILPTGSTAPDNTTSGISTGNLTITDSSLSPATTYDAYVRAYCSTLDQSEWVGPVTFTTNCVAVSDFVQDFEGTTGTNFPTCWSKVGTSGATYPQSSTGISGSRNLYMYSSSTTSRPVVAMVPVNNAADGTHRMKMKVRANYTAGETLELGYLTNPSDATTFVAISSIVTNSTTVAQDFITVPTGMPSGDVVFALRTGTVTYSVLVDDIIWEEIPTVAPSCATNVVAAIDNCGNFATAISWDAVSGAEGYKIVIGTTSGGNDVVDNQDLGVALNYSYEGTLNTTYYFTVIPYNAAGDAVGCLEQSFTTSSNGCYCMPSSTSTSTYIDNFTTTSSSGTNISNVSSGYTTGGYADNSASMSVVAYSGLSFDFNAEIVGGTVGFAIWIDWNNDYNFDSTERVFNTTAYSNGPFTGSIAVPSSVADGNYRMRILTHFNSSNPSDPCASNTRLEAEDYTLTVETASCVPATIGTANIVADCANGQYNIDFDVTSLGDGTPSITDGTNFWSVTLGTVTVGPFTSGSEVSLTLLHGSDNTCDLSLGDFVYTCPPSNDECDNAIALTVNSDLNCGVVTAGTTVSATDSGIEPGIAVTGTPNNDVWFSFEATATSHQIALSNVVAVVGTATDMGMAVFSGSCSSFALVADSDPNSFTVSGLTIGDTYYVSVYGWASGTGTAQTNFDICVGTSPAAPSNDECDNAIALTVNSDLNCGVVTA